MIINAIETVSITTKANSSSYVIDSTNIIDKGRVYGFFVRKRTGAQKSIEGKALINDAALECAFLTIKKGSKELLKDYPLEHAIHSPENSEPYTQIPTVDGIGRQSYVRFSDPSVLVDDEVLEIVFITDNAC